MIKLIAVIPFIAIGVLVGWLIARLAGTRRTTRLRCIMTGVSGSFGGLLLSDIAGLRLYGNVTDALLFSSLGALVLALLALLLLPAPHPPSDI